MTSSDTPKDRTAIIFDIEETSFVDGPGMRTTVFFKGCNLRCDWCHNPESQDPSPQWMIFADRCTGCGKCRSVCPNGSQSCTGCGRCELLCPQNARKRSGKSYDVPTLWEKIRKNKDFFAATGGGVTFSGGECMLQIDFLTAILQKCHEEGIHTAVDTAGNVPFSYFERILDVTDLFLYDIKCMDRECHRLHTGVFNDLILENARKLSERGKQILVRIPVIGGVNDSEEELLKIRRYIDENVRCQKVELLPYHTLGEHKYRAIGKTETVYSTIAPDRMRAFEAIFR